MARGSKDFPRNRTVNVRMNDRHLRILRLARVLFGTPSSEVLASAIELYEKKFNLFETARKFMEDGTLKTSSSYDTVLETHKAKVAMVKERQAAGLPLSIFDKPIPESDLEELLKG